MDNLFAVLERVAFVSPTRFYVSIYDHAAKFVKRLAVCSCVRYDRILLIVFLCCLVMKLFVLLLLYGILTVYEAKE